MFLIDTNVWLERLLEQNKSREVEEFFKKIDLSKIYISDFTLHSIGVIMTKLKNASSFINFIDDIFANGNIKLLSLSPNDLKSVIKIINKSKLDFDDAYQLYLTNKYNLRLVSFDNDFIKSGFKTLTPNEALKLDLNDNF